MLCILFNTYSNTLLSNFYNFGVLLLTTYYHPLQHHFPIFGFSPLTEFYKSKQHDKVKRLQKYTDKVYINSRKATEILQNSRVLRKVGISSWQLWWSYSQPLHPPVTYTLSLYLNHAHFLFSPLSLFGGFFAGCVVVVCFGFWLFWEKLPI